MITLDTVLSIILALLELTNTAMSKATPEQAQDIINKHNEIMDFWMNIFKSLHHTSTPPLPTTVSVSGFTIPTNSTVTDVLAVKP